MTSEPPPPPTTTATEVPWTSRSLGWRSAWPSVVIALAAFQAGVLVTLAFVWGRLDEPRLSPPPVVVPARVADPPPITLPAAAPLTPAPPPAPPPIAPRSTPRPAPALVEVQITSSPEGATVKIGGAVWGVTPLTAFLPGNQPAALELELAGHDTVRTRWNPTSGGAREIRIELSPSEHRP